MEALVFCGMQASGETTFYAERLLHSHVRLSLDTLRTRHRELLLLLSGCLRALQSFVVGNSNPTAAARVRLDARAGSVVEGAPAPGAAAPADLAGAS